MRRQKIAGARGKTVSIARLATSIAGALFIASTFLPNNASGAYFISSPNTNPPTNALAKQRAALPTLLSDADAARYADIFRLQNKADWAAADRQIAAVSDRVLLAPVEAQRYLSPHYRATYAELSTWLDAYPDAPDAERIYKLAEKRHTRGELPPAKPVIGTGLGIAAATPVQHIDSDKIGAGDEAASDHGQSGLWLSGLAAWRSNRIDRARHDFEALAKSGDRSPWTISAAAFWAARAELRTEHPEMFNYWLGIAAANPRTFYGLLARRTLGVDSYIDFDTQGFSELDAQILTGVDAGRRALALIQISDGARAEAELRVLAMRAPSNLLQSIVALADSANMASLSVEIGARVADDRNENRDRAQYPVPQWKPRGGFQVDRALLYGVMRQESKFRPVAHNPSGASGLMQLMPATASTMAAHTGLHGGWFDPSVNLALAQQYIIELLDDSRVNGNLLYFAVAYNRGPGALPKAKADGGNRGDPLMFVESVTNKETRFFIHQVLTNYWIYRLHLGQPTPDLDALAAGEWPIYTAEDNSAESLVRHAEN